MKMITVIKKGLILCSFQQLVDQLLFGEDMNSYPQLSVTGASVAMYKTSLLI